jgi:hypothetical protein
MTQGVAAACQGGCVGCDGYCCTAEAAVLETGMLLVGQLTRPRYAFYICFSSVCLFVQPAWPFATLTLYLECRCEGAKDPHGSFACLHAAPGMLLFLYRTMVLSPAYTLRQSNMVFKSSE